MSRPSSVTGRRGARGCSVWPAPLPAPRGRTLAAPRLLTPFEPRRIFGAASNFIEHAAEMQTKLAAKADSEPYIFLKTVESVIGPR